MNIRPINKNILVEELKDNERKTVTGIIIHSAKIRDGKFVKQCRVIATDFNDVKAGDKVIINAYGPQQISFEPIQFIVKPMDILAIFE